MGTGGRIAVALLAVVAAGVLFFVLRDDDESSDRTAAVETSTAAESQPQAEGEGGSKPQKPKRKPKPDKPEIPTIVVRNGQPVGGVQELTFTKGDRIRFRVRADAADEVHLHGYDVTEAVPAGGTVTFDVPATLDGVFEAELHHAVAPIAEITVEPK